MPRKISVVALTPVRHNDIRYEKDATFLVNEARAAQLVADGVVVLKKDAAEAPAPKTSATPKA